MRVYPVKLIVAADNSKTETGAPTFVGQCVSGCITVVNGDATAAGTVTITGSNEIPTGDPYKYAPSDSSFVAITGASSTIASGVGPAIVLATMNYQYIRAVFTHSGGGSTTITVTGSLLSITG